MENDMRSFMSIIVAALLFATPALADEGYLHHNEFLSGNELEAEGGNAKAYGGDAESDASASSRAKSIGIGKSFSHSGVYDSGNSKVRVDAETGDMYQGQAQKTNTSDSVIIHGDDVNTTYVNISPPDLSDLPAAHCQGSSQTGTLGGGGPGFSGLFGFGNSNESDDCNIRENMKLVGKVMSSQGLWSRSDIDMFRAATVRAIGQLTGFEGFTLYPDVEPQEEISPLEELSSNRFLSKADRN